MLHLGSQARASHHVAERSENLKESVCEILKNPKPFDGRVVTIEARVLMGSESLTLVHSGCTGSIWLAFPDEMKQTSHTQRPEVRLSRDDDFDKFQKAIGAVAEDTPQHQCQSMHCMKYDVQAEITGRIDYRPTDCTTQSHVSNSVAFECGYGHLGAWNVELVLEKVIKVVTTPNLQ